MLSLEEEQRILESSPPYLRVATVLLAQTGGRTYTEGFSLRWDQIDFDHKVMFFGADTKTEGSSEPVPLTGLAHDVLLNWKKEQADKSRFLFPSPVLHDKPITSVRKAWTTTLERRKWLIFRSTICGTYFVRASVGLRPTPLCSAPCGIPVQKPNATINWGWWSRCGKI